MSVNLESMKELLTKITKIEEMMNEISVGLTKSVMGISITFASELANIREEAEAQQERMSEKLTIVEERMRQNRRDVLNNHKDYRIELAKKQSEIDDLNQFANKLDNVGCSLQEDVITWERKWKAVRDELKRLEKVCDCEDLDKYPVTCLKERMDELDE